MPLVTIFTPTYNRAHTLHRVYDSLVAQSFKDFEWLVINDGSTDHTDEVMAGYIAEGILNIHYINQENRHKFLTTFHAVEKSKGKYFAILDSDDALTYDALEVLSKTFEASDDKINFVIGYSSYNNEELLGSIFPKSPLLCSGFQLRYQYQVKGDKWGLARTESYKKIPLDLSKFYSKGFVPEGVYLYYQDQLGLHKCINHKVGIIYRDHTDEISLANNFYSDKNAFGLAETYKAFVDAYRDKWISYPKVMFRNLLGYLIYSAKDRRSYRIVLREAPTLFTKFISSILYLGKPFLARINIKG